MLTTNIRSFEYNIMFYFFIIYSFFYIDRCVHLVSYTLEKKIHFSIPATTYFKICSIEKHDVMCAQ